MFTENQSTKVLQGITPAILAIEVTFGCTSVKSLIFVYLSFHFTSMVWLAGFEPATPWFQTRHSNQAELQPDGRESGTRNLSTASQTQRANPITLIPGGGATGERSPTF